MSDLISRQGALAKIRTRLQDWAAYGNEEYRRGLYACEDMILSLPSAEPNKTMKGSDLISRADAIDAVRKIVPVETEIDSTLLDKAEVIVELSVLPSAEPKTEVVRCEDCKHKYVSGNGTTQYYVCDFMDAQYDDNGFCHHGERKGGEDNEKI
jgi:hypothetical protein